MPLCFAGSPGQNLFLPPLGVEITPQRAALITPLHDLGHRRASKDDECDGERGCPMSTTTQPVYSYFPGCSLEATNRAYDISTQNVARVLGLEMVELEDWNCCGATPYMAIDSKRSALLSARNLAISEQHERDIVTVCSRCFLVLHKANCQFHNDSTLRGEIRKALQAGGMDYQGKVRVRHLLDLIVNDLGQEAIERHVVRPLEGIKVACYYGCQ